MQNQWELLYSNKCYSAVPLRLTVQSFPQSAVQLSCRLAPKIIPLRLRHTRLLTTKHRLPPADAPLRQRAARLSKLVAYVTTARANNKRRRSIQRIASSVVVDIVRNARRADQHLSLLFRLNALSAGKDATARDAGVQEEVVVGAGSTTGTPPRVTPGLLGERREIIPQSTNCGIRQAPSLSRTRSVPRGNTTPFPMPEFCLSTSET